MKRSFFTPLLAVVMLTQSGNLYAQCATTANIYSFSYNGHNYEIVKELKTWADAAVCAVERGGHLVHIDNQAENDAIYQKILVGANVPANYTVVDDGGGIAYLWIGGSDGATEGTWLWDGDNNHAGSNFWTGQGTAGAGGGQPVGGSYVNWGCSTWGCEPDDFMSIQDAAGMALGTWPYGSPGQWNDLDPNNSIYFVIEYEPTGITDHSKANNFQLYPNPAIDYFSIQNTDFNHLQGQIKIYHSDGRLVKQMPVVPEGQYSVKSLMPGIYMIEFQNGTQIFRYKFVKE